MGMLITFPAVFQELLAGLWASWSTGGRYTWAAGMSNISLCSQNQERAGSSAALPRWAIFDPLRTPGRI